VDDVTVTHVSEIEDVYRESGDRLWWALLAYTGDRELASDAAAEAYARAVAAADSIRDPAAWVWRVAFRVASAEIRQRRDVQSAKEATYEIDDLALEVLLALSKLSPRQRAAFVLFYLDDRTTEEIAELLAMSRATVSVHLHRARRRLRSILGDDDA
jgi:RNA polymerase sigma factor (sigma-70 family)